MVKFVVLIILVLLFSLVILILVDFLICGKVNVIKYFLMWLCKNLFVVEILLLIIIELGFKIFEILVVVSLR